MRVCVNSLREDECVSYDGGIFRAEYGAFLWEGAATLGATGPDRGGAVSKMVRCDRPSENTNIIWVWWRVGFSHPGVMDGSWRDGIVRYLVDQVVVDMTTSPSGPDRRNGLLVVRWTREVQAP